MGLKERVERILREQTAYDLQAVSEEEESDNRYAVDELADTVVRVRGGRVSITQWTDDRSTVTVNNWTLNNCMDVLLDAGFQVEQVADQAGGHLLVRDA